MITIIIQLDGASAHNIEKDIDVKRSIFDNDLPIIFRKKPPQSQDLNVLDLGYFNSIQGLQYKKEFETVNDLVSNVLKSYEDLDYRKLLNVWITLQLVMLSIIRVKGDNTYHLTHINNIKLEQGGKLSTEVLVNESIM